jgi:hypothetical protein
MFVSTLQINPFWCRRIDIYEAGFGFSTISYGHLQHLKCTIYVDITDYCL